MLYQTDIRAYDKLYHRKSELERRDTLTRMEDEELRRINKQLHSYSIYALEELEEASMEEAKEEQENCFDEQSGLWKLLTKLRRLSFKS